TSFAELPHTASKSFATGSGFSSLHSACGHGGVENEAAAEKHRRLSAKKQIWVRVLAVTRLPQDGLMFPL
ncbi:MAG: hypothetical protein KAT30_11015, partial [Candidatus Krumholzibacteria bacterium]|nr:hypothetical protein [Candidatus Krumholzibacteria bacterium]